MQLGLYVLLLRTYVLYAGKGHDDHTGGYNGKVQSVCYIVMAEVINKRTTSKSNIVEVMHIPP